MSFTRMSVSIFYDTHSGEPLLYTVTVLCSTALMGGNPFRKGNVEGDVVVPSLFSFSFLLLLLLLLQG